MTLEQAREQAAQDSRKNWGKCYQIHKAANGSYYISLYFDDKATEYAIKGELRKHKTPLL